MDINTKFGEELIDILIAKDYQVQRGPNPVEILMLHPAAREDLSDKKKIHELLLKELREALMEAATNEEALEEEAEVFGLPIPDEGFQQRAINRALNLISQLKDTEMQEEVDQLLAKYKKDPFFRS